jgi:hypothetical protein
MSRDDEGQGGTIEGAATRRGFLLTLLGGLAGAAGVSALSGSASAAAPGTTPAPGRNAGTPIDNIFTPLRKLRSKRENNEY